jgi:hypothetical protein
MASKSKAAQAKRSKAESKINFYLIAIPVLAFVIKLITMANIRNVDGGFLGGWLGADGDNYLKGLEGLVTEGYLSDEITLSYWPAGYPILIWLLTKISLTYVIALISFTQTIFYAYASYYFVKQLRGTRLQPYMFWIAMAIAFNPTLSLTSLAVGYESPIAACMLMVVGLIMKSMQSPHDRVFISRVVATGFFSALATLMQPRWILTTFVIAIVWALVTKGRKTQALILVGVVGIMAIAPAIMIDRNVRSIDRAVISTNLGAAMRIGAGDETSGRYIHTGPEVPCNPIPPATSVTDNELVKCVIDWYFANPSKAVKLFVQKGWYYWAPWTGPIGNNGTMNRNPWLKIDPVKEISIHSEDGFNLIYGSIGKVISVIWVLSGLSLFFIGFFWLRSMKGIYANLAFVSFVPVVISWLVAMGTIGDHRFRIPTMPLSLFLQVMGFFFLRTRVVK